MSFSNKTDMVNNGILILRITNWFLTDWIINELKIDFYRISAKKVPKFRIPPPFISYIVRVIKRVFQKISERYGIWDWFLSFDFFLVSQKFSKKIRN